jgi:3-hydroxyacyl-CoA dehydrogenase
MTEYRTGHQIRRVCVFGAGTIGASWAAYFLAHGLAVTVIDPAPDVQARVRAAIAAAWPKLRLLDPALNIAPPSRIAFFSEACPAALDVDFVQENMAERLADKQAALALIDSLAPPEVVIASSTSGLTMSDLQARCATPGRTIIGHPMNPPHLIPLVELVGGRLTDPAALQAARGFYEAIGKKVVGLRKEMIGHLATRLTVALWREAAYLVASGAATVADVDAAVTYGPGLRSAVAGPHLSYHLGGGPGGLAAFFGWAREPLAAWCGDLGSPVIDAGLEAALVEGVQAATGGRPVAELAAERDERLLRVLQALYAAERA